MNKSLLVILGILAVIIVSGCTEIDKLRGIKEINAVEQGKPIRCSDVMNALFLMGMSGKEEQVFKADCLELCGNSDMNYEGYECRKDDLICKCRE